MDSLTVAEAANVLGRGQAYVRDHAKALGGRLVPNNWVGVNRSGKSWRFPRNLSELQPV